MTSLSQSNIAPMLRSWPRILTMLSYVHLWGWMPCLIAAFSAGSPKASKPIGKKTLKPRIRRNRAAVSEGAIAYQWPQWRSPEV